MRRQPSSLTCARLLHSILFQRPIRCDYEMDYPRASRSSTRGSQARGTRLNQRLILSCIFPEPHDSSHRGSRALATRLGREAKKALANSGHVTPKIFSILNRGSGKKFVLNLRAERREPYCRSLMFGFLIKYYCKVILKTAFQLTAHISNQDVHPLIFGERVSSK